MKPYSRSNNRKNLIAALAFLAVVSSSGVAVINVLSPNEVAVGAPARNLNQLQQNADAKLAQFWQVLTEKQNNYYQKHGEYFQLLVSPVSSTTIKEGTDDIFITRHPSDGKFLADIQFSWADTVPFQIEVHAYDGPNGKGYLAVVTVYYNDRIFRRERDNLNNDTGWYEVFMEI